MGKQIKPNNWNRTIRDRTTDGMTVVRDTEMRLNPRLPGRVTYDPFRGSAREYVWTDDAACRDTNPELFQVSEATDPGLEGIGTQELRQYNLDKVEQAKQICESCPVKKTCLSRAEPTDLYWSVRGGETPTRLIPRTDTKRPYMPVFNTEWIGWHCKEHGDAFKMEKVYKDGTRPYCGQCSG
jgi:hypothetical protein